MWLIALVSYTLPIVLSTEVGKLWKLVVSKVFLIWCGWKSSLYIRVQACRQRSAHSFLYSWIKPKNQIAICAEPPLSLDVRLGRAGWKDLICWIKITPWLQKTFQNHRCLLWGTCQLISWKMRALPWKTRKLLYAISNGASCSSWSTPGWSRIQLKSRNEPLMGSSCMPVVNVYWVQH